MLQYDPGMSNISTVSLKSVLFFVSVYLLAGCSRHSEPEHWPFSPEVEEFVEVYVGAGGDKLTDWMQDETTSTPEEALLAFNVTGDLEMELAVSEPVIRQPVSVHFDERGRLWVVQYIQYPFPAGITIQMYDQYLRAEFDGVPAPPPNHVPGADKITVLEDTNGDGVFDSHQDVITGLNITTSVLTGGGGVWVMNPPYLLFYPDETGDGLPDGNPEVRLEGFGLEDTHSLANSLRWGPDGWIYGVHGSTSTATVRDISFLGQAVWRYHPDTDEFELFAQGGGNPWTLSFDSQGRAFSGDNGGNNRGFHWVQGGRYQKNFPKHGPFTRPHSYGHFSTMDHEGYTPRFAMTFTIYEEGRLPGYEGQLISGMAMTSRVQATQFLQQGSTFRTEDTDSLAVTSDRSFRPVDTNPGPDGAVYFADWCDVRMDHTDPRDTWDKSCGRIWRLQPIDYQPAGRFSLAEKSSEELIVMLADERKWYREQARRILGERKDESLVPELRRMAVEEEGPLALEALWTANLISGMDPDWSLQLLDHTDASVRRWTIRLLGDGKALTPELHERLLERARSEHDAEVRSQLASSIKRFETEQAVPLIDALIQRDEDTEDRHIPLLIWWAVEEMMSRDADRVLEWTEENEIWQQPVFREHLSHRIARRLAAERGDNPQFNRINPYENWLEYASHPRSLLPDRKGDYTEWITNYTPEVSHKNLERLAHFLGMSPDDADLRNDLLRGVESGLDQGPAAEEVPELLIDVIASWWEETSQSDQMVYVAAMLGYPEAIERAAQLAEHPDADEGERERMAVLASFERGRQAYLTHCALCHQDDGAGMDLLAAPLRDSEWVLGDQEPLVSIILNGFQGDMLMPPMGSIDDRELADILTYIRSAWGHDASYVSEEVVRQVRDRSESRTEPWTAEELSGNAAED
jgi:putative membrane-bound dehydrogenase-like protein